MAYSETFKEEVVRLRVEDQLSLKAISERMGISKGTASLWLRQYPLPTEVVKARQRDNALVQSNKGRKDRGSPSKFWQGSDWGGLSTSAKGKVSELAAAFRMALQGFEVYASPFDGDKADWMVETPAGIWKVQVKTVTESQKGKGLPYVTLRRNSGRQRYQKGEFDFIIGYDFYTDTCYVWSWDEVAHLKSAVVISPEAAERWDKF